MEVKTVASDAVFRTFTACPTDPRTLLLDVRDKKKFDKGHIAGAYCIRLSSNGSVLLGEPARLLHSCVVSSARRQPGGGKSARWEGAGLPVEHLPPLLPLPPLTCS